MQGLVKLSQTIEHMRRQDQEEREANEIKLQQAKRRALSKPRVRQYGMKLPNLLDMGIKAPKTLHDVHAR